MEMDWLGFKRGGSEWGNPICFASPSSVGGLGSFVQQFVVNLPTAVDLKVLNFSVKALDIVRMRHVCL
jgi:hypothetical protein